MYTAASFTAGFVFGLGLLVSGMVNPAKVLGFLDLAGAWDPSLALVMAGAGAGAPRAFALLKKSTPAPLGAAGLPPPPPPVDKRALFRRPRFGGGWGPAGRFPPRPPGL